MAARKLLASMMMSINGYFEDRDGSLGWVNLADDFHEHSISLLNDVGGLLFGRVTYEGMVAYWPVQGFADLPEVADRMHMLPKYVVSTTLDAVDWNNTTLIRDDAVTAISALKAQPGQDLAILGSSTLTCSLLAHGLVDELRLIVMPVALAVGRSTLSALTDGLHLEFLRTTVFRSGNVLLSYRVGSSQSTPHT